jgi:hypothetical protein
MHAISSVSSRAAAWLMLAALGSGCAAGLPSVDAAPPALVLASATMAQAARVLASADALELESTGYIRRGNTLRKEVGRLRAAQRQLPDERGGTAMRETIDALAAEIEAWEEQGGALRARSQELEQAAQLLLIDGFADRWEPWISNSSPLILEAVEYQIVSHNPELRSVKTSQLAAAPSAQELPEKHRGMSIRVPDLASQNAPDNLNVSSFRVSRDRKFFAHVEVEPGAQGPEPVPLGRIHQWRLLLSDLEGRPVENAVVEVIGHMPGHVHGLPTQPRVLGEVAPGVYRVDGLKFQMNGWWVIEFNVKHGEQTDTLGYNLVL